MRLSRAAVAGLAAVMLLVQAAVQLAVGRPSICTCGYVALWHGPVDAGNSQHLLDWYSLSHVVHGLILFALAWVLLRGQPVRVRFLTALAVEAGWEVLENTPFVIDRYRMTATALGYVGDSVVNSLGDVASMSLGFLVAARLPAWVGVALAVALEAVAYLAIRDNLILNIIALAATFR